MTDTRLHPTFLGNLKVDKLDDICFRVYTNSLVYAGSHETDGHIPRRALRLLHPDPIDLLRVADLLVVARLWEPAEDGYTVHDFLHYQTPAEQVERTREAARIRKQRERDKQLDKDTSRGTGRVSPGTAQAVARDTTPCHGVTDAHVTQDAKGQDRTGKARLRTGEPQQTDVRAREAGGLVLTPYLRKWAASRGWPADRDLDQTLTDWGPLTEAQWCQRLREATEPAYQWESA